MLNFPIVFRIVGVGVATLLAASTLTVAPAAAAQGAWSVVTSPSGGTELNGVACVAANDCTAVGGSYSTLIQHWDGVAWTTVTGPNPGIGSRLNGVACVAANDCTAVGSYDTRSNDGRVLFSHGLIQHWDGVAWTTVTSPDHGQLNGVACVAANDCTAVGRLNGFPSQTLIQHWDGVAWSTVTSPSPGNGENVLNGVACVAANDCTAVGGADTAAQGSDPAHTLIEHWDGVAWSIVTSPNPGTNANVLNGVVCAAANDCTAVGRYDNGFGADFLTQTLIQHWNGVAWSTVTSPSPGTDLNYLTGVACVAANDCTAVGEYSSFPNGESQTLIQHWNGVGWATVASPSPGTDHDPGVPSNVLNGVVCVAASECTAVGSYRTRAGTYTLIETITPTPTPTPGSQSQTPASGEVTVPQKGALYGTQKLAAAGATTPSGERIGVSANVVGKVATRGDGVNGKVFQLRCLKKGKTSKPKRVGYGQWCSKKQGKLVIKVVRHGHKLRITWYAPATGNYAAYALTETYKT